MFVYPTYNSPLDWQGSLTHMVLCSALIKVAPPLLGSRSTTALLYSHEYHSTNCYAKTYPVSSVQELIFSTEVNLSQLCS